MELIDSKELWRQIPPEEKLQVLSNAHAKGVSAMLGCVVLAATLAVGFEKAWILWVSLVLSPLVFQFVAGKQWRANRPRTMLEYLAARSAARRFAFSIHGDDLQLQLLFRGEITHDFGEDVLSQLDASVEGNAKAAVWVALFGDAVVLMSEARGGARLEFGHQINSSLDISIDNHGGSDYSNDKEIIMSGSGSDSKKGKVRLTSKQSAAMVVFQKKILKIKEEKRIKEEALQAIPE